MTETLFVSQIACIDRLVPRFSVSTISPTPASPTVAHSDLGRRSNKSHAGNPRRAIRRFDEDCKRHMTQHLECGSQSFSQRSRSEVIGLESRPEDRPVSGWNQLEGGDDLR